MTVGLAQFVMENQPSYQVAYGVSLGDSVGMNASTMDNTWFSSVLMWQGMRFGWLVAVIFCGMALGAQVKKRCGDLSLTWLACSVCFVTLGFIPYMMTRIDGVPAALSRTGRISLVALWCAFPVALLIIPKKMLVAGLICCTAIGGCVVALAGGVPGPGSLALSTAMPVPIDRYSALFDGAKAGLPGIGRTVAQPAQVRNLQELKGCLAKLLKPGETFVDLTNSAAFYLYLDYPIPVNATAIYNVPATPLQKRYLEQVRAANAPVALIAPAVNFDGFPVSVRANRIYRYMAETRVPVACGQFRFLVPPGRADGGQDRLSLLDEAFHAETLHKLPVAWGRSWSRLAPQLNAAARLDDSRIGAVHSVTRAGSGRFTVNGDDPYVSYGVAGVLGDGRRAGLVSFDFSCDHTEGAPEPVVALRWQAANVPPGGAAVLRFSAEPGRLLVPLDSAPRWLLSQGLSVFQVGVEDARSCTSFGIANIQFWQWRP
jgi:hypothetical protein